MSPVPSVVMGERQGAGEPDSRAEGFLRCLLPGQEAGPVAGGGQGGASPGCLGASSKAAHLQAFKASNRKDRKRRIRFWWGRSILGKAGLSQMDSSGGPGFSRTSRQL